MRQIEFYRTGKGKCPVEDFFDSLSGKLMQKIAWTLKVIKEIEIVPKQYLKKLEGTDNIWEIRVKAGSLQIRILCFWESNNMIILTSGLIKKTRKLPAKEIKKAQNRMFDYLQRKKNER